jgi:hypothetical protein
MLRLFKWGTVLGLIATLGVASYSLYLYGQIRASAVRDEAQPADAIVVLGAAQYNGRPSPVLKARLDHALQLYSNGLAQNIITTGSYGADPNFSEAEVGRKYLVKLGADMTHIVTEQGSGTTYESWSATDFICSGPRECSAIMESRCSHHRRRTVRSKAGPLRRGTAFAKCFSFQLTGGSTCRYSCESPPEN